MSEGFLETLANKVLTEAGLVAALLLIAVWWLSRLLKTERDDRRAATQRTSELAEAQAEGNLATSTALLEIKNAIALLAERVR